MKKAIVTGVTGQDGAYLAELLLGKGYEVHGIKRRSSLFNTDRIDHLYQDPHEPQRRFILHHGDLTDSSSLVRIIQQVQPDEIYNLAAQSHVAVSFEEPEYTANSDAIGTLRILEAIRILGLEKKTRFYQASTSELFGKVQEIPQTESTPFYPRSPYAVAKLYAYWITVNYREAYGIYACNGILFNHECVALDTPLIIRTEGIVDVVTAGELIALRRKGPNVQHFDMPGLEVWDGAAWTAVTAMTATKRRQQDSDHALLRVQARAGVVCCTAHHQLLRPDEETVRADQTAPGESLLLAEAFPPSPGRVVLTEELAELLGLLAADGYVPDSGRTVVQFTNNDPKLQQRVADLWSRLFLGRSRLADGVSGFGSAPVSQTYLSGAGSETVLWLRSQLYSRSGFKRVPRLIINAPSEVQHAFLRGYYAGDGLKAGNGESIKTNSAVLAQGLYWLFALRGRMASVYVEQRGTRSYYQLNFPSEHQRGDKGAHLRKPEAEIRAIESAEIDDHEWVIDFETGSGHFLAGVGRIVVHNSPIRGETFVTRKITRALARIKLGLQDRLYLGNLDAKRDWGHARDYVVMQWLMLQQEAPEDFVIATGEQHSVREFVTLAAREVGIDVRWEGSGVEEKGYDTATGDFVVAVDPRYFRPTEVETLLGDPRKAREQLGWKTKITFAELVREMMREDLKDAEKDALCSREGFRTLDRHE